jgi:hypothetical protein
MTLKELRKHYRVLKFENQYHVYEKERSNSRMVHKYLCTLTKKGGSFIVPGYKATDVISKLKENVQNYVYDLKYDSEYYHPLWREESRYNIFTCDVLSDYGFTQKIYSDYFILNRNSIYGYNATKIELTYEVKDETIIFRLWTSDYGWIETTSIFDFDNIKETIDSLLKPLLLTEGIKNIQDSDKMVNSDIELVLKELKGFDINSSKVHLKEKLIALAESL